MGRTTYYVSSSEGNDSNAGTSVNQPWKTLAKVNGFKPVPGDQILFKRGDEWEGTLVVPASGNPIFPITYGAYGTGDKPKIYGSKVISGWKHHSGNIYKAVVDGEITQLFADGKRMKAARYPDKGYLKVSRVESSVQFTAVDLPYGIDYTDAIWTGRTSAYTLISKTIRSSNSRTIILNSAPEFGLGVGEGFMLTNKLEFLNEPGEWFYDAEHKAVYFWSPSGGSPANLVVRGSGTDYGVDISSKKYITIDDLEFLHYCLAGISIRKGYYVTVNNNNIMMPEQYGVFVPNDASRNISITRNGIYGSNHIGILSYAPNTFISDNIIEDTGLLGNIRMSMGRNAGTALFSRAAHCTISYNRISNAGYNGINFWGINNMIKFNYINGACLVLDDGGGIYCYNGRDYTATCSAGSNVASNIILNVNGNKEGYTLPNDGGSGIYMDDGVNNVNINSNTIHRCTTGILLHLAGAITVEDNQISDCLIGMLTAGAHEDSYWYNNVVYSFNRNGAHTWWKDSHQRLLKVDGATSVYDYNKYIHPHKSTDIFNNNYDFEQWKAATGQDANSVYEGTRLEEGETEYFFYNASKLKKVIDLGNSWYKDLDGNFFSEKLLLEPFTSKILIKSK